ncbi:MAG TPA: hypothetical protein VFI31_15020, partial [Pirellulales bacterium]|nr:hypothetical protein [Pirellulales bacterium]
MRLLSSISSIVLTLALLASIGAPCAAAEELLPSDRPVEEIADLLIDAGLIAAGVTAAPAADDATYLRRVTLDLAGRIP